MSETPIEADGVASAFVGTELVGGEEVDGGGIDVEDSGIGDEVELGASTILAKRIRSMLS